MLLMFFRHATAEPVGSRPDDERALIEKGWKQVRRAAAFCRAKEMLPDLVLASPLRRTRETATGFCHECQLADPLIVPWLAPGNAGRHAIAELDAFRDQPAVMLVGHEPDFSQLAATLLGSPGHSIAVTKASLVLIDIIRPVPGRGILRAFVPNRMMA